MENEQELKQQIADVKTKMVGLRDFEPSLRAAEGTRLNNLKRELEDKLLAFYKQREADELNAKLNAEPLIDITIPTLGAKRGNLHPITQIMNEVADVFSNMGFIIEDGPEIVTEFQCFDSLNSPKNHPSRDIQDTFWLSDGRCLRTQTSAHQNYMLKKYGHTFKAICPGRTYRNESVDATHDTTFFQVEGMMVGEDISIANLIYFMRAALAAVFKKDIKVRLRPGYFPFVEPGFELDASCPFCENGCPICKHNKWIEFCGCGMIHPTVLTAGGIDPNKYQGFAFGFGLTRLAMMRWGINDIRLFNGGNIEFLSGGQRDAAPNLGVSGKGGLS
jgi:phenylalanyl-tRNA synthetase alpha chain